MAVQESLIIAGEEVAPGYRKTVHLELAQLYTGTPMQMVVEVLHGNKPGPVLLVCAAIHGDELNGVEICRQLLMQEPLKQLENLHGSLVAVPVVNLIGFVHRSRYMPDRRDLNRCFPGNETGSLGARLAHIFTQEILSNCSHAIDLHTGAIHRSNLPQIRASLEDSSAFEMARHFNAPLILNSKLREGSLRATAGELGIPLILYEAGEAFRFDNQAIEIGVQGVMNVMAGLGMLPSHQPQHTQASEIASSSSWVRAPADGCCRLMAQLGEHVTAGQSLATIAVPQSPESSSLAAPFAGVVIGCNYLPLVNQGDALFHIARLSNPTAEEP